MSIMHLHCHLMFSPALEHVDCAKLVFIHGVLLTLLTISIFKILNISTQFLTTKQLTKCCRIIYFINIQLRFILLFVHFVKL